MAAPLVLHEQRWLPALAHRLPLAVPTPVRVGRPGCGYPWSWSVCPWLPGDIATGPLTDRAAAAATLGAFVLALAVPGARDFYALDLPAATVLAEAAAIAAGAVALLEVGWRTRGVAAAAGQRVVTRFRSSRVA